MICVASSSFGKSLTLFYYAVHFLKKKLMYPISFNYALLDKTNLQAKIERTLSEPFYTNLGAPQGDSLSPVLFIIYLELAMR